MLACIASANAMELGVYLGAGCTGAQLVPQYEAWLGRPVDQVLDFFAYATWTDLINETNWAARCWAQPGLNKRMVFAVPMVPSDGVSTLAQGAAGAYDQYFQQVGTLLVQNGFANATLRIGWEFNGGWYPWSAKPDPTDWVTFWRRIVADFRAVPGAQFKFDWNPNWGQDQIAPSTVYPGDDVVDYIGMDMYNQDWGPNNSIVTSPQQRWKDYTTDSYGLNWLATFAAQHNKPISFPEWGTGTRPDGYGGGDDPYFIQQMAAWMQSNNVAYADYFDYNEQGDSISCKLSGGQFPQSATMYIQLFGSSLTSTNAVTVATSPSGLTVVVDGSSLTAPQTFNWTPGSQHSIGVTSPQGTGSTRYVFANWSDSGDQTHEITAPSAAATYTATFGPQYLLTTSVYGSGSITANPTSGDGYYNSTTSVKLTASPSVTFTGWSGDLTGATNPQLITMNAPHSVSATFSGGTTTGGLYFYPVTPCRAVDTRSGKSGAFGPPSLSGGTRRDLTTWPYGQPMPTVSTLNDFSTVNPIAGRVVANAAIVPAGTNGSVCVYTSDASDVIIDINGYFAP